MIPSGRRGGRPEEGEDGARGEEFAPAGVHGVASEGERSGRWRRNNSVRESPVVGFISSVATRRNADLSPRSGLSAETLRRR
jgi:hypothetical protein